MKAKFKSGKIITGKLAKTFTKLGITKEVRKTKPTEVKVEPAAANAVKKAKRNKINEKDN